MKIYDCSGTFDSIKKEFNLSIQLTNISPDSYSISAYYDISDANRYAIVAILQTLNGNQNDLSNYPANYNYAVNKISFSSLNKSYWQTGDKDINAAEGGDTIDVIIHHGIGFNPVTNTYDDLYIKNYKAGTYTYYQNGAKPGKGGKGLMI